MCFLTLRVGSEVFYYNRCLLPEKVVLNALWDSFSLLRVSVRHQVTCVLFLPEETSSTTDCFLLFVADVGGREAYASLLPCMKAKIFTTHRWITSHYVLRPARSVDSGGSTATPSACDTSWKTQVPRSRLANLSREANCPAATQYQKMT